MVFRVRMFGHLLINIVFKMGKWVFVTVFFFAHICWGQSDFTTSQRNFDEGRYKQTLVAIPPLKSQLANSQEVQWAFLKSKCLIRLERSTAALAFLDTMGVFLKPDMYKRRELYQADSLTVLLLKSEALLRLGQNKLAIDLLGTCLNRINELGWQKRIINAELYNQLGLAYWSIDNLEQATDYLQLALEIKSNLLGESKIEIAGAYNNLGLVYASSNPQVALINYQKALGIFLEKYGKRHPSVASCLNNIAFVHNSLKKNQLAQEELIDVLEIRQELYGEDHPEVAFTLASLGTMCMEQGLYKTAEGYFIKALGMYQKNYGQSHPEIATVYNQLGVLKQKSGDYQMALAYLNKATQANLLLDMHASAARNPQTLLNTLFFKAQTFELLYRNKSLALQHLEQAFKALQQCDTLLCNLRVSRVNQKDRLALGKLASEIYPDAVRILYSLHDLTYLKKYKTLIFTYAEKNKASVLQQAIAESNALQFANLPKEVLEKEKQLRNVINETEHLMLDSNHTKMEGVKQRWLMANAQFNRFSKEIEAQYPAYFNLKYSTKTLSLDQFQAQLPESTQVVSYLIDDKMERLYVLLISKSNFKVKNVAWGEHFQKKLAAIRNMALHSDDELFVSIASDLFKTLLPFTIKHSSKLIIVPEGKLGTIPFELLLTQKPKAFTDEREWPYLVKKYAISYSYSFGLLYQRLSQKNASTKNVLMAAPISFDPTLHLSSLHGSESEVGNIGELLLEKQYVATILRGDQANESNFKKASEASAYEIIHLATHGMVNENDPEFSQIYLRATPKEDGSLYSGEIYNLSLKARLITLSACETGLGKLAKGEGVLGLTRALIYAGASNVMVSLWKVSDSSTATLMEFFYSHLLKTNDLSLSLQMAKLDLLKQLPANEFRSSIYYWSPFILVGH